MFGNKSPQIPSRRPKLSHPAPGSFSSDRQPSLSSVSEYIPQTSQDRDNVCNDRNGGLTGSYPGPPAANETVPCGFGSSKKSTSPFGLTFGKICKNTILDRSKPSTSGPGSFFGATTRYQPSADDQGLPSPCAPEGNLRAKPSAYIICEGDPGIHTHPPSGFPSTPPASSRSDQHKMIIGATRLILQTAASALSLSPIPKLGEIPNLILIWLQVYETVDDNDKNLKGLHDEIQRAYKTILQPLQMWTSQTGEIPPEVVSLVKEFHSDLEEQIEQIQMLGNQKIIQRVILRTNTARKITDVKACITRALSHFATVATTLNLLNTIRASVDYELSKLPRADAEYNRVKSKSECLKTTRDGIRSAILSHLREPRNRFVWLRGSPGTGKTAISMSVASALDNQGTLAASFFWDKNQKGMGLDSVERFPSTLALQLAAFSAEYKSLLLRQIRERASLKRYQGSALEKEMNAWIIDPMRELTDIRSSRKDRFIIVLDGLDECGDPDTLGSLMKLVLLLDELPPTFAILVSCRPEPQVISAWARAEAQDRHPVIPCEDVDKIARDETFHTIHRMVEEGLQDCIRESPWKPSNMDLNFFTSACRGLPLIASIRIREVRIQTQSGSVLKSEFEYFLNLMDAPEDLNEEYLRIMRRAYMPYRSRIRSRVVKNYHEVLGMIIAVWRELGVYDISQLLGITEDEVYSTLKPIGSIVNIPSGNTKYINFYHGTAREFITGDPIGEEEDKVFFISDTEGHFLGPRLLRIVNDVIKRNEFGVPTKPPLGDEKKWQHSLSRARPNHIKYAFEHVFNHLDRSLLISQDPNELQREFGEFLARNLFSLFSTVHRTYFYRRSDWDQGDNHRITELMREVHELFDDSACVYEITPWHFYRSSLPFIPSSSLIFEWYRHLSDPIHVFSISGDFAGRLIPLSDDALQAQEVMRAKQRELPTSLDEQGRKTLVINYKDEFLDNDVRNGTVTCAALSRDGRHIALGFGSGVIEVADIDDQCTVSRFRGDPHSLPAWIEFVQGRTVRIATEDTDGNISILGHSTRLVNLGPLPSDPYPAVTAVSDNGSFVLRVPRNPEKGWYENTTVLCVSGDPSVKPLASPFTPSGPSTVQPLQPRCRSSFPLRHMIGFSPTGRYVGAYDKNDAFVWSTDSCQLVSRFCVHDLNNWIINTGVVPPCSYATPKPTMFFGPTIPLILDEGVESPESMPMHDSDESWLTCPFYDLSLSMADSNLPIEVRSFAAGRVPLIPFTRFLLPAIWFNGRVELFAPFQYEPIGYNVNLVRNGEAWYGDRLIYSDEHEHEHDHRDDRFRRAQGGSIFSLPQASRNGTRFLIQGRMKAPLVVDISQVI